MNKETRHLSKAQVETEKAARYLKALCNHFNRKVTASYDDTDGHVDFLFGKCALHANPDALLISAEATSEDLLARVEYVVADHLVRFANKESLQINWIRA